MKIQIRYVVPVICAMALPAVSAKGATISYGDSISIMTTNWTADVSLPKFDPSLGALNSVILELNGSVKGNAKFESMDASSTTVTTTFAATIRLRRQDLTELLAAMPSSQLSEMVSSFDGDIDFGGTSGRSYDSLDASETVMTQFDAPLLPADEDLFVGAGEMMTLNVRAEGQSRGTGSGNLLMLFNTVAAADVNITYDYTPIPEPSSLAILSSAVFFLLRRRAR